MKRIIILLMFVPLLALAQNVSVTDYRVPISRAQTLRFDGSYNWSQNGTTVTSNNATATLLYRLFYSSLPIAWFLDVDATGGKNFSDYNHNVVIDGSFRKYVWDEYDWFAFSRLTATHADFYKQIASDLTVGFGYGRYIDATALAKAVRIEEHLINDKVVTAHLPKETMINIANIIEREAEFKDRYADTYETYWFAEIENELVKSGMLTGNNVGAIGILRMRQVLFGINERVNQRFYGWDVTGGVLFPLSTYDKSTPGDPNLTIGARYAFPINWRFQVNTNGEALTPIDSAFAKEYRLRATIDFIYELSNRVNFVSTFRAGLYHPYGSSAVREYNVSASFWYYLENNIYLTLSGDFTKQGDNPKIISTRVGLQYNVF